MRICDVYSCEAKHRSSGYCMRHYARWKKHGDPTVLKQAQYKTPEEAFSARTVWVGECLVWTGAVTKDGYGMIRVDDRTLRTHRWAFEKARGLVPKGLVLDHTCHNRPCANVEHLRAVTQKQNMENPSGLQPNNQSGHVNVHWRKGASRWIASLCHNREVLYGGRYPLYELHVAAYYARKMRDKYFTNSPKELD